ncbi:MAG: hypothetical protein NTX00_00065 [Candidatus Parcubacteria bacterium]|nr:hypothetical protein [Candidatus Parcubacteria bacterium]
MSRDRKPSFKEFTKEELREKMFEFSPEAEEEFRRADRDDKWLLGLNLKRIEEANLPQPKTEKCKKA